MKLKQLKINYLWWSSLCYTHWGNIIGLSQYLKKERKKNLKELGFWWHPECGYFLHPSFVVLFYFSPSNLFLLLFHRVALLLSWCACPRICIMLGITITLHKKLYLQIIIKNFSFFLKNKSMRKYQYYNGSKWKGNFKSFCDMVTSWSK